jgi:hypothetical protein
MTNINPHKNTSLGDLYGEIWENICDYEALYKISNLGRVKSLSRTMYNGKGYFVSKEKIISQKITTEGYYCCALNKNNKTKFFLTHRLLAKEFIDNPLNKKCVNHIDSIRSNNKLENLEWVSYRENNCHRKLTKNTSSKYTGVHFNKSMKKWCANIFFNKKLIHLGTFLTEEEAYKKRCDFEKQNNIDNKYL